MKLFLAALLLAAPLAAQTIAPSQIKPGENGQVMTTTGGKTGWASGEATVSSVFGRIGAVLPVAGDYNCSEITGAVCSLPSLFNQTIDVDGAVQHQRPSLNFINGNAGTVSCVDNPVTNATDCTFTGGTSEGITYSIADVTGSHSANVAYQNTSSNPMFIGGSVGTSGSSTGNILVAQGPTSFSLPFVNWANQSTASVSNGDAGFTATIMPGYWYMVQTSGDVHLAVRHWVQITSSGSSMTGGSMVYPGAGVASSTGGSWDTSYSNTNPFPGNFLTPFIASGSGHAPGGVPDPGASSGATRYLREDSTWAVPPGGTATSAGNPGDIQLANGGGGFNSAGQNLFNYNTTTQKFVLRGIGGIYNQPTSTLPGYNFGNGIGTSIGAYNDSTYLDSTAVFTQGNTSIFNTSVQKGANGDFNIFSANGWMGGANIDSSAQGLTVFADQMTVAPTGVYTAAVSSTGTPSGFPGTTIAATGWNGSGNFGAGRILINTSTATSFTATGATAAGSGHSAYTLVTETGQTYAVSKQGTLPSLVNGPTLPNDLNLPINQTISVTIGSACSAGDSFTIGGINIESAKILASPAPSFSGGVLTFHAWIRSSHEAGAVFFCEGPTGTYLRQNADDNGGAHFLFYVLGATAANTLAVGRQATATMDGAFIAGSGTDTVYQGGIIVDARDPSTGAMDGSLTLSESAATFTPGDSLEAPNGLTQRLYRYLVNAQDSNPYTDNNMFSWGCASGSTDCGNLWNDKRGWINWINGNPDSAYTYNTPTPGRWTVRGMFNLYGPMGDFAYFGTTPRGAMFEWQNTSGAAINLAQIDDAQGLIQWNNVANARTWNFIGNAYNFGAGTGTQASVFNFYGSMFAPLLTTTGSCAHSLQVDTTDGHFFLGGCTGGSGLNQLTGDVLAGPGTGSQAATLATVNGSPGTVGDATHTVTVAVNAKGLTTSALAVPIAAATINGTPVSPGGSITIGAAPTGTAGGDLSGSYPNPIVSKVGGHAIPNSGNLIKSIAGSSPSQFTDAAPGVDYQAPPLWAGTCIGQFNFTDTTGAAMVDSCNGYTGSIANVTRTGQGYVVTASPASSLQYPSQVNNFGTVMFAISLPLYVTGSVAPQPPSTAPILLAPNASGNTATDFSMLPSFNQALGIYSIGQSNWTVSSPANEASPYYFTGTHILAISCPSSGVGPIFYIDGTRFYTSTNTTGYTCNNVLTTGNWQMGSSTNNGGVTGTLNATIYSARFTNLLTDQQVAQNTYTMQQQVLSRGIPLSGQTTTPLLPQYVATGDSITCGFSIVGGTSQCGAGTNSSNAYANLLAAGGAVNAIFPPSTNVSEGPGAAFFVPTPLAGGTLTKFDLQFNAAVAPGTYTMVIGTTTGGGVITIINSFPITVAGVLTKQTFTAPGDFTAVTVPAGSLLGIYAPSGATHGPGVLTTSGGTYYGLASATLPAGPQTYGTGGGTLALDGFVTLQNTTRLPYQTLIYGQSAAAIQTQVANVPWLYGPQTQSLQGNSIASILEGINNFIFQKDTPQQAWQWTQAWATSMRTISAGTRLLAIDLISKGGAGVAVCNGSGGFADLNACRDGYNNIARQSWASSGFAAFDDIGADPLIGCDSCNASAIYFNGDTTHPSAAGQAEIANSVGCLINAMDGSTPGTPNPVPLTAATYTTTCGDGGLIADASSNNINITLNSALWQTGRTVQVCNNTLTGTNTVTLTAPSDFPFNNVGGSTSMTVANHSCANLKSTFNGNTAAPGDFWRSY